MSDVGQPIVRVVRTTVLILAAFTAGFFAAGVLDVVRFAQAGREHEVGCVRGGGAYYAFCKGTVLAKTVGYPDTLGGVNTVLCGVPPLSGTEYHFFPSFLSQPCSAAAYSILFSDGKTRTRVEVRDGKIAGIFVGPLHTLDL